MQPLQMNELVKSQMEAAGFQVNFEVMDWNALLEVSRQGRERYPNIHGINISRATQDPYNAMMRHVHTPAHTPRGANWGHYTNPTMDTLINQALSTFDEAPRQQLLIRIHELMNEDAAMLWVAHDLNPRALSPRVQGFVQAQSWFQDLTRVSIATR
jgi:ABC-type transport system substrate-binding protein